MVSRFYFIPGELGGHDGTMELLPTLGLHTAFALHSYILRVHCSDPLLQPGGMSPNSVRKSTLLISCLSIAWEYNLDSDIGADSTSVSGVVSCQLLSYGIQWVSNTLSLSTACEDCFLLKGNNY